MTDIFRGKDILRKTWLQGHLVTCEDDSGDLHSYIVNSLFLNHDVVMIHHEIDADTVCASPGIRDKNNQLVFANDIVAVRYEHESEDGTGVLSSIENFIVIFSDDEYAWKLQSTDPKLKSRGMDIYPLYSYANDEFEVIGNIYDDL